MNHKNRRNFIRPLAGPACAMVAGLSLSLSSFGASPTAQKKAKPAEAPTADVQKKVVQAEPRSPDEALKQGLDYIRAQQQADGGWNQGGGWRQGGQAGGRVDGAQVQDPSDLGNTCVSLVALLRAGDSAADEPHRDATRKAFEFICEQIEKADDESLYVTSVRDTQLQVKIGTYVDTFLSGWALSELKGRLADDEQEKRRVAALDKVVGKIERHQGDDGSFTGNKGWAAVLSQGLASKALNFAARSGAKVSTKALDKDQQQNLAGLDVAKSDFGASAAAEPSSAGVSLYREAAKIGGLQEKTRSNESRKKEAQQKLDDPKAPAPAKEQARAELEQFANDDNAFRAAQRAISGKLGDTKYVAGFGNNGGEEFLSYMNLGEGLRDRGGKEWDDWKGKMQSTLCSAQNQDGSWAGQHCITGRTFCTSAALLTLLIDKASVEKAITSADTAPTR